MSPAEGEIDPRKLSASRVFVVGGGLMGSGIAAQAALAGYLVTLSDVTEELAAKGLDRARAALDHAASKGRIPGSARTDAVGRIDRGIGLRRVEGAELVVEAIPEDLALKRTLFAELERLASPSALLASNTSSLPITSIAQGLSDPGRVVGIHFFNPVLQMELVELIPGERTRPEVVERARSFSERLGKTVVTCRAAGFVTSRAVAVLLNEAAFMLYEGVASREDIDAAYRLGFHHPMGPLELLDLVGIDTALAILDGLFDAFHDPKYRACPLLRSLVAAGRLGRKTGEGIYPYPARPGPGAAA